MVVVKAAWTPILNMFAKVSVYDDFENALELVALNLRLNFLRLVSRKDVSDFFPSFLLQCFDEAGIKAPEYMQRSRQRRRRKHDTKK